MFIIILFYTHQKFLVTLLASEGEPNNQSTIDKSEQIPNFELFTVLDNLASIGGLTIPLYLVGNIIIRISNWLTGNELVTFLLTHLYKTESDDYYQSSRDGIQPASIMKRKPFYV